VLASLLMPATMRAMREGEKTQCKSNLNQIHHGLMIYSNTFATWLPHYGYYKKTSSRLYWPPFWTETMAAFLYPDLPLTDAMQKAVRCPRWSGTTGRCRGYAANYGMIIRYYAPGYSGRGPLHQCGSMRVTEITMPSNTLLVMDGRAAHNYTPLIWPRNIDLDGDDILDTYRADVVLCNGGDPYRHDDACMTIFVDGHAKHIPARRWLTDDDLFDPFH